MGNPPRKGGSIEPLQNNTFKVRPKKVLLFHIDSIEPPFLVLADLCRGNMLSRNNTTSGTFLNPAKFAVVFMVGVG